MIHDPLSVAAAKPRFPVLRTLALLIFACAAPCQSALGQLGEEAPNGDPRVRKILDERKIKYTVDSDGDFKVVFELDEGRSQVAFIASATETYRNLEIREIVSPAYQSETDELPGPVANKLLADSADKKLGGWQKRGKYGLFVTKISAKANNESLWSALKATIESADAMEEQLTGNRDEF
jgi:hypothetical protein